MPVFEMVLMIQKLEREALKQTLKRAANYIFEQDGVIRQIENLGVRELPYLIKSNKKKHKAAHCFIFNYDCAERKPREILEKLRIDSDIVRASNFKRADDPLALHVEKEKRECTLHMDLLPPPFRPTVMELQKVAKKRKTVKGKNTDDPEFDLL